MELKKSYRKVRCVSLKGDQVRFVPEHLVDEVCKVYKMEKQDMGETFPEPPSTLTLEEAKAKYEELTGKKAGNMKLENILIKIEELTKQ